MNSSSKSVLVHGSADRIASSFRFVFFFANLKRGSIISDQKDRLAEGGY